MTTATAPERPRASTLCRAGQSLLDAIEDVNWKMSACGDSGLFDELYALRRDIARAVNRLELIQGSYPHLAGGDDGPDRGS